MSLSPEENGVRTELGQLAVGLYDFEGVRDDNLPFKKGEVIVIQEMNESGWWKGVNSQGRVGIFPYNYVNATSVKHVNYRIVKAVVSFTGVDDSELSFEKGDKITILKPIDEDWSFGRIHSLKDDSTRLRERVAGRFPLDHVEDTNDIDGVAASDEEQYAEQQKFLKEQEAKRLQQERRRAEEEAKKALENERKKQEAKALEMERKEKSNLVRQREEEKAKLEDEVEVMKRRLREIEEEAESARKRAQKAEDELQAAKAEQERLRIAKEERDAEHDELAHSRQMHRSKFVNDKMNQSFVKYKKADGFESPGPAPQQQKAKATIRSTVSKFSKLGQGGSRCKGCNKLVGFGPNSIKALGGAYHRECFQCGTCSKVLRSDWLEHDGNPYCSPCHRKGFGAKGFGFGGAMAGNYTV